MSTLLSIAPPVPNADAAASARSARCIETTRQRERLGFERGVIHGRCFDFSRKSPRDGGSRIGKPGLLSPCEGDVDAPAAAVDHVVLLHASGSSARQWTQAAAELAALPARLQVHTVEFHGHGSQAAWQGEAPLTLTHEAALVEALLQRLGGAHVVGHSYGGAVALKLAACRPALVRSVVAFEPVSFRLLHDAPAAAPALRAVQGARDTMRQALADGRPLAAAQAFIDFWSPGAWATMSAERQRAAAARVPVLMQQFGALSGDSMDARRLARLRVPLLLLSGARTVETARTLVRQVRAALPQAPHEVLPEMGHMGPVTHAAVFNRRIADFLAGQPASRALCSPPSADCRCGRPAAPGSRLPDSFRTSLS